MQYYNLRSALRDETGISEMTNAEEYIDEIIIVIQNMMFGIDANRYANFRLVNLVSNEGGLTFSWESKSEESICPRCGTKSNTKRHTYKTRILMDEPILGKPVTHCLRENVYICTRCGENGANISFVEDISTICRRPYIKTTINLDEKIVNDAIERSANGLAKDYEGTISVSGETILNRLKEAGGMVTEKNLTDTTGVKILSVDDNNSRKGAPSSAYTVVVDIERHIILVVAKGADSETAQKIFNRFPDAEKLSRDRDCAYAKAGKECKLEQIADIFHLVANAHDAVKEALSKGLDYNIYVKEGEGWVELPVAGALPETAEAGGTISVSTLADDDITQRVHLASLSAKQEEKYRTVIELLRLHDQGLSSKEIDKRLGIARAVRVKLFSEAAEVISGVEEKIDEYYANIGQRKCRQKTIVKKARHSSDSIVEPYSEVVMKMVHEGHTHRAIHPVIKEMGYTGSANAIYQYILKRRHEAPPGQTSAPDNDTPPPNGAAPRPPRVSIQRTTKTAIYKFVLREASAGRKAEREASQNKPGVPADKPEPAEDAEKSPLKKGSDFYSAGIAEIIMGKEKAPSGEKKTVKPDFKSIADQNPVIWQSVDFLRDLHSFIDKASIEGMDIFIAKYSDCGISPFEKYAKGIKSDYRAVENAILNRDINNGQIEGFNDKIKLLRRIRFGRSKEELVNAFSVLSTQPKFRYSNYPELMLRVS